MNPKPTHPEPDRIACQVCLKEIPRDLAKSEEASEYVHYFCGTDCYAKWQSEKDRAGTDKEGGR